MERFNWTNIKCQREELKMKKTKRGLITRRISTFFVDGEEHERLMTTPFVGINLKNFLTIRDVTDKMERKQSIELLLCYIVEERKLTK